MTSKAHITILAIDDEPTILKSICSYFEDSGYAVQEAENGCIGLELFRSIRPDIILVDLRMPEVDGLEVLTAVTRESPNTPIIVVSGTGTIADVVEALRLGAWDYILKPVGDMEVLDHAVARALERARLRTENKRYQEHLEDEIKKGTADLRQLNSQLQEELSERQQAEKETLEWKNRYEATILASGHILYDWDSETGEATYGGDIEKILGYSKEEMEKGLRHWINLVHPEDRDSFEKTIEQLIETKGSALLGYRVRKKDGDYIFVENEGYFITDALGNRTRMVGFVKDITERKQNEEKLKDAYDIISKSPAIAFLWKNDEGWPVEFVSPNVKSLFGFTADEFTSGKISYTKTVHPDDLGRVENEVSVNSNENGMMKIIHEPYRILTKKGGIKWIEDKTYIRRNNEGRITHYQGIVEDITDQIIAQEENIKLEKQLQQAQKMEALGTLAGGIAHDFNNILGGIIGYTELAQDTIPADWPATHDLDKVLNASGRAKDLVDHILAFSRQSKAELTQLKISIIVKEALKLLRASLPTTIEIRRHIQAESEIVNADPAQIHQLLMNLCTNAAHAMSDSGGVLEVRLAVFEMDEIMTALHPKLIHGPYLKLTVSDTGSGMSPEVLERIFDPYFTTKEKGEGTGLGLAVVHGIVKGHGGEITFDSELGTGTTFHVYLPKAKETKDMAEKESLISELPTGHEHILIIDDEQTLEDIGKRMLESLGYKVAARTSSIEALELFQSMPDRFDLIITDQTMPNMTGSALAAEVLRIRPDIPVILCTGFSEVITEEKAKAMGIRGFVKKPIAKKEIARIVKEVLNS